MRVLQVSLCVAALAVMATAQARPRVFISASAGQRSGFAAELLHHCPGTAVVTLATAHAGFTVALVDTGDGLLWHPYHWSLANDQGDVLAAGHDRTMRGAAKDVCRALHRLPVLRATGQLTSVFPGADQAPRQDQLTQMIGVVVGEQQSFAQQ